MYVIQAVVNWLGVVGEGGEASPLSPTSSYSEILRVVQMGIFAGVLYLIKQLKHTREGSDETHSTILSDLRETNGRIDNLATKVDQITTDLELVTKGGPKA